MRSRCGSPLQQAVACWLQWFQQQHVSICALACMPPKRPPLCHPCSCSGRHTSNSGSNGSRSTRKRCGFTFAHSESKMPGSASETNASTNTIETSSSSGELWKGDWLALPQGCCQTARMRQQRHIASHSHVAHKLEQGILRLQVLQNLHPKAVFNHTHPALHNPCSTSSATMQPHESSACCAA